MKVTVVQHRNDPPLSFYHLGSLCDVWRGQGHEIVVQRGTGQPVRGDVVFLHVDLTVVPPEYVRAIADHPCVVNRHAVDISKSRHSQLRVYSRDDCDGPVIVKTVRNHGGHPERRLRRATVWGRLQNAVGKVRGLSLATADHLNPTRYPVFPSARDVPRGAFTNPALIVERFVPERYGDMYGVRRYLFLGDAALGDMLLADSPHRTSVNAASRVLVPIEPAVVARRHELEFDFGKFDFVMHNGQAVLLDANRTPAEVAQSLSRAHRLEVLSPALESLPALLRGK